MGMNPAKSPFRSVEGSMLAYWTRLREFKPQLRNLEIKEIYKHT